MLEEKLLKDTEQTAVIIFQVGWEQFAIELLDVKEIVPAGQIRKLPKSLDYIDGIYNYRGEIIHVVNLSKKLNLNEAILYQSKLASIDGDDNNRSKFIMILNINNTHVGFLVDRIINVAYVEAKDIVNLSPIFQTNVAIDYIKGIVKLKDRPRILINLEKILVEVEQLTIQKEITT